MGSQATLKPSGLSSWCAFSNGASALISMHALRLRSAQSTSLPVAVGKRAGSLALLRCTSDHGQLGRARLWTTSQGCLGKRARAFPGIGLQERSLRHSYRPLHAASVVEAPTAAPASSAVKEAIDYTKLVACVKELKRDWVPAKVHQVVMADKETLALKLRAVDKTGWLYLSWHPMAARLCVGGEPQRGESSEAFPLAQQASARLLGQVLLDVSLPVPFERVARLDFGFRLGETPSERVMCEIQGRYSNVILTDGDGTIVLATHQVGGKQSSLRQIQVGSTYSFPPQLGGLTPTLIESRDAWVSNVTKAAHLAAAERGADAALLAGMTRAYLGCSSSLARELAEAAGVRESANVGELSPEQWGALWEAWQGWLARLESGAFAATRAPASNRCSVLGAFSEPFASANDMIDMCYRTAQGADRFIALRAQLQKALALAQKRQAAKLASFEKQLSTTDAADATQKQADLITANVYQWPAGAASLTVHDWDTGEEVTLELSDPAAGPVACAKKLYAKAAKQRRAATQLEPLILEARSGIVYLQEIAESLAELDRYETVEDLRALQEIQDELVAAKVLKPPTDAKMIEKGRAKALKAAKRRNPAPGGEMSKFRVYESPSGLQVLIGRNNVQNDELSCRVANDDDVWMHARGVPGSHLILRIPAGREASQQDLQFAANLSTFFSKARESGKCDVVVATGKDIKKPKGARPGQVLVLREKVMTGYPSKSVAAMEASGQL